MNEMASRIKSQTASVQVTLDPREMLEWHPRNGDVSRPPVKVHGVSGGPFGRQQPIGILCTITAADEHRTGASIRTVVRVHTRKYVEQRGVHLHGLTDANI